MKWSEFKGRVDNVLAGKDAEIDWVIFYGGHPYDQDENYYLEVKINDMDELQAGNYHLYCADCLREL